MIKKIYGLVVIIIFSAMLSLPTLIWGGMLIVGGDEFVAANIEAQLVEEEQRAPMTFADVFKGKTNEDGTVEPFSINDLTANLESFYNDYAPFRAKLINVKREVISTIEKPYEKKIKPALIELWYGDKTVAPPTEDTVADLDDLLGNDATEPEDTTDQIDGPGVSDVCEHDYVSEIKAPTCLEAGYTTHTCSKCGDFYSDSDVPATGHSSDAWVIDKLSSCTEDGKRHKKCDTCETVFDEEITKATGHSYKDFVTEPTCTEQGYTSHVCQNESCEAAYTDKFVNATGHSSESWITDTPSTCTETGKRHKKCTVCETEFDSEITPETGHSYTDTVIKPTCTENGYTLHTCKNSNCGHSYSDTNVAANGHSSKTWITDKANSCTEDGKRHKSCDVCGVAFSEEITKATGHSYKDTTVPPTCIAQGYDIHECQNGTCEYSYKDKFVGAEGHKSDEWIVDKENSCTEDGKRHKECTVCETEFDSEILYATGHSYTDKITEPTCLEQGYTTHTCTCGDSYVDSYVNANGHSYGEWTETKKAKCTEEGEEKRTCSCGAAETRKTDATGHSYTDEITEPTCTERGYTTHTCTCGESYVDSYVNANGHSYTDKVTKPTCLEQGYTTHTCACGVSYVDSYVNANGHKSETWIVDKNATETEEGLRHKECDVCGESFGQEIIPMIFHTFTNYVYNNDATCTGDGTETAICDDVGCGATHTRTKLGSATGHSYDEWTETKKATCTTEGEEQRACSCGATETRKTDATGHSYTDKITEPTCTERGYTTHTCTCGVSYVDSYVNANGHSYDEWTETKKATCTEDGEEERTCSCGASETRKTDATGHSYTDKITEPTCTERGYTTHTCTCGVSYVDSYVNANGHKADEWTVDKANSCTEDGKRHKECDVCGAAFSEEITKATGHNYRNTTVEPTCTAQGYDNHECQNGGCGHSYTDNYVNAKGHKAETWTVSKTETCTENGSRYKVCETCSAAFGHEVIPAVGHNYKNTTVEPTCTAQGYDLHECQNGGCGHSYTDNYVNAKGHKSDEWTVDKVNSCTEDGKRHKVCTVCGASFADEIVKATGHNYKNTTVEPTCTAQGYDLHECQNQDCGHSYTDSYVSASGHTSDTWQIKKNATCTVAGERYKICSVCGKEFANESIKALGHSYDQTVVPPTCTAQGYTVNKCTNGCGDEYNSNHVSATGHKYEYITDVAASCGVKGSRHKECSVCHDKLESEVVPMITAHSGSTVIKTVSASYEDVGYTLKKCDVCGRGYRDNIVAKLIDNSVYPETYAGSGIIGRKPNSAEPEWLFYKDDISWYKGGAYGQSGIKSNYNNIKPLLEYCESKGIKLVIAAWPNKSTVYSEYMPTVNGGNVTPGSKMKGYIDGINAIDPRVHGVFPVEELKAYNSYFQTYFKYDTHWNMAGAYVGVQSIYKSIGYETTDLRLIPVTAVSPSLGNDYDHNGNRLDLIGIVGYQKTQEFSDDLCYDITYRPEVTYKEYMYDSSMQVTKEDPAMFIGGETTKSFSDNARYGKIVFIGDSFRNYVRPFLAKDFKETTVLHYNNVSHVAEDLKELGEGDVLVISRIERAGAMHDQLAKQVYSVLTSK